MIVKHLLVEERGQSSGLRRIQPEPIGRAASSHTVLFFKVSLELLRNAVLEFI